MALIIVMYSATAQTGTSFKTVTEYLDYCNKKYDLPRESIYYVAENKNTEPPKKIAPLMFFKGNKMAVIEDVANEMGTKCPPKRMMSKVTLDAIEKSLFEDKLAETVFTNMLTRESLQVKPDEIVAVFLYSHEFGRFGQQYIKERSGLEALGIRSIIVSTDESVIVELVKH